MTITISISEICDAIYAMSALQSSLHPADERPAIVGRDRKEALAQAVKDTFSFEVLPLAAYCANVDVATADPDLLVVEFDSRFDRTVRAADARLSLRCVVEAATIETIWRNTEPLLAGTYAGMARMARGLLRALFDSPANLRLFPG